jgi:phospholipid-binding lipoprotein MlaA
MTPVPTAALRPITVLCLLLLAGCATTGERHPADPWEPGNRKVFAVNQAVDRATLRPAAKAYEATLPKWMRNSVTNFFKNLDMPITIANQLLQGKPKQAGQDTLRFAMNTTLGIGGLFDPASDANLPVHDEDFGQTLGRWGVPPGPFLMLPLLGPSHVRDLPSNVFNAFIRDAYMQRRLYQVWDGNIPERFLPPEEEFFEDEPDTLEEQTVPDEPPPPGGQAD